MKYNFSKKEFFKIKLYSNGKLEVEDINATNFHPSRINEIMIIVDGKNDYHFTISSKENLEKNKLKLVKYNLKNIKKDLNFLNKQYNIYTKTYNSLNL
jgi:hypothetical protein